MSFFAKPERHCSKLTSESNSHHTFPTRSLPITRLSLSSLSHHRTASLMASPFPSAIPTHRPISLLDRSAVTSSVFPRSFAKPPSRTLRYHDDERLRPKPPTECTQDHSARPGLRKSAHNTGSSCWPTSSNGKTSCSGKAYHHMIAFPADYAETRECICPCPWRTRS